jgi:hypothetical protein
MPKERGLGFLIQEKGGNAINILAPTSKIEMMYQALLSQKSMRMQLCTPIRQRANRNDPSFQDESEKTSSMDQGRVSMR